MSKYFTSILFLLLSIGAFAQDDEDDMPSNKPVSSDSTSQLRLGFDISRPVFNALIPEKKSYEIELDFYGKKEIYYVLEGGWGSGKLDSTYLRYSNSNTFFKAGINKGILQRLFPGDWDMAFIGLRYGIGFINRSDASYLIVDSTWGNSSGIIPGKNLTAHWFELTGGVRVELFKGLFAGWNIRGKFILNGKQLKELPPYYIAGYGKGDKASIFDFNFYLDYAIRWKRKHVKTIAPKED
ncbi:MAG: hypothetical protein JST82_05205 [Bacteroidetes bacterium]|nr:hypothetical protein [Bacteroidota bacterium]